MKLQLCLKKSYSNFFNFKVSFFCYFFLSFFILFLPVYFFSFNKGKWPQLRQVMIISDIIGKMGVKLHV